MVEFSTFVKSVQERVTNINSRLLVGSLTYYMVLAIVPIVSVVLYFSSWFINNNDAITSVLSAFLEEDIAYSIVEFVLSREQNNIVSFIVTMVISITVVSNGVHMIIKTLDSMYGVHERNFVYVRFRAVLLTLLLLAMLSVMVVAVTIIPLLLTYFNLGDVWLFLQYPAYIVFLFSGFAIFYNFAPNFKLNYNKVYGGAGFAAIGVIAIIFFYNIYVSNFANYDNIYGPIAHLIVLLIAFNFIAYTMYIGMCINVVNFEKITKE